MLSDVVEHRFPCGTATPWFQSMITTDQCLEQLIALTQSKEEDALSLASGYVEAFVPLVLADRARGARLLADLKGRLSRRVGPSLLRSDMINIIEARIVRLLDAEDDLS